MKTLTVSKMMDYDVQFESASTSQDTGEQSKKAWYFEMAISGVKLMALPWLGSLSAPKHFAGTDSNNQNGSSWVPPEAEHCTISPNVMHLVKLQDLPVLRNRATALQTCFHKDRQKEGTQI